MPVEILDPARAENRRPHGPQPCQPEFEADQEQQEDDAELRDVEHGLGAVDASNSKLRELAQPIGPDQHAGKEVT